MMGGGPGMMGGRGMMGAQGMMGGGPGMMGGGPGMMGGPGAMRPGGAGGGRGGQAGDGQAQQNEQSTVTVTIKDNAITLRIDVNPGDEKYDLIRADLQAKLSVIKGEAEMIGATPKIHELAEAFKKLVKDYAGKFPQGAHERKPGPERRGVPYPPDQRVSWMAELLPYLGYKEYSELYDAIAFEKSWRDPENQIVATSLVSQFLNPWSSRPAWWVPYPKIGREMAGTHFVGIAGIGLDAAGYDKDDKTFANKIGVFHYDWQTSLEDMTKPEYTIAILQVPYSDFKMPWIAGGGSTVRGVDEDTGVKPFVCEAYTGNVEAFKGKVGTYAIMANGDVRFIPRDIPKDVFLKMCSLTQADKIDNLDDYAPLLPAPKVEKKPVLPPLEPEPKRNPEPLPKAPAQPPAAGGGNAGGGAEAQAVTVLNSHCAQCHTGPRARGKTMIFNQDGSLNASVSKDAISQALAEGKMPPKNRPRPSQDDLTALQNWLKGGR
jgi:hypothetical protein